LKWGSHEDENVRAAIATCLLEHLLENHFDLLFPRVETAARSSISFAKTTSQSWKFGEAKEPMRAARFDRLCSDIRRGLFSFLVQLCLDLSRELQFDVSASRPALPFRTGGTS